MSLQWLLFPQVFKLRSKVNFAMRQKRSFRLSIFWEVVDILLQKKYVYYITFGLLMKICWKILQLRALCNILPKTVRTSFGL